MDIPLAITVFFAGATTGIFAVLLIEVISRQKKVSRKSEIETLQQSVAEWRSELAAIREILDELKDDLRR